jgi:hypothetical protein
LLILSGSCRTCRGVLIHIFEQQTLETLNLRKSRDTNLLRRNRYAILFNNRELQAIEAYCKKYRVDNKTRFMREAILTEVLKRFDSDYPTLFEFEKPNLFSK